LIFKIVWINATEPDMVILEEQLIRDVGNSVTPLLGKKIPGSEKIAWLGSEVRLNGNFVWKK